MLIFFRRLFSRDSATVEATKFLVDALKVKITRTTLSTELEEHPNYPSLLSISDVLNKYGVETLAIKLDQDKICHAPVPFLTLIRGESGSAEFFTVIKEIRQSEITIFNPDKYNWDNISKENFLMRFSGTLLLAQADEFAGEKEYSKKNRQEVRTAFIQRLTVLSIPIIMLLSGVPALVRGGINALPPCIFSILTLLGAITSALLLLYDLDQYNPVLRQICGANKKVNCASILNSKYSKIAGISWSSIGLTYFMGQMLLLSFTGIFNLRTLFILSWLNVLALPYVLFSIYYQSQVAKQWCVLCLCTQGILLLQFITALLRGWHSLFMINVIDFEFITMLAMAFSIPLIGTALLMPALKKVKETKGTKSELQRFKHDFEIFEALLLRQRRIEAPTAELGIVLGNQNAKYKLVKVCNPYCGPCAQAHLPFDELLKNNPDVQLQIIFTATNRDVDPRAAPVRHLLAIAEKNDQELTKRALDDWYLPECKDYKEFAKKYPLNGELAMHDRKIDAMFDWCNNMNIHFTPTIFVNGHQLPSMYSVNDLQYILAV